MEYITSSILKLKRKKTSVKGDNGKVLVIGGSSEYSGAPVLAALACEAVLRCGADWVTLAAPSRVAWVAQAQLPDMVSIKLSGNHLAKKHEKKLLELAKNHDVVLIGPGVGRKSDDVLRSLMKKISKPKVVDADAIKCLDIKDISNAIITPHKKEFEMLCRNSGVRPESIQKYAGTNVILLKGPIDKIMTKDKVFYNKTGNEVMSKAGTGDVLAGLCAGFLAQTRNLERAAKMAAYLNGKTGDVLKKEKGVTFIASDIVKNLYKILR